MASEISQRDESAHLQKAEFDPKVCTYWLVSGIIGFACSIIFLPLLLIWIPVGKILTRRYLGSMECILTKHSLLVKKGIFTRIEKTIPLQKITDVGFVQGPLMRKFGVCRLTFETAGSSGAGALVSLDGIRDPQEFREAVLAQCEAVRRGEIAESSTLPSNQTAVTGQDRDKPDLAAQNELLVDIRDSLRRIESTLVDRKSDSS